jgi:hypothetical protein
VKALENVGRGIDGVCPIDVTELWMAESSDPEGDVEQ